MIKDEVYIYKDIKGFSKGITEFLFEDILNKDKPVNIALSGGNTPLALFSYWSSEFRESSIWKNIRLFWGDERCVSPENDSSNYGTAKKNLLDKVQIPPENIFRIKGEEEPQKGAIIYSELLQNELPKTIDNIPQLDVVILGLGDDGHTASIFPSEIDLWDSPNNCVVANHPATAMKRISITGKIINNALKVIFLVTGDNKSQKINEIIKNREMFLNKYPAAKVNPKTEVLYWFLDENAATLL